MLPKLTEFVNVLRYWSGSRHYARITMPFLNSIRPMCFALLIWPLWAQPGVAQTISRTGDGIYNRFDGDFVLAPGGGIGFEREQAFPVLDLQFRYLDSMGPIFSGEWHIDQTVLLNFGVLLRPIFLLRLATNHQSGNAWLDLLIDSLQFETGLSFATDVAAWAHFVGGSLEVPILADTPGVALRFVGRYRHASPAYLDAPAQAVAEGSGFALLTFRLPVRTGLASWEN